MRGLSNEIRSEDDHLASVWLIRRKHDVTKCRWATLGKGITSANYANHLWIEEAEELFFIMFAERGSGAHMPNDGSGDAGRKAFRSQVAAGAILPEDARAFVFVLL